MILAILSLLVFASYVGVMIYKTKGMAETENRESESRHEAKYAIF